MKPTKFKIGDRIKPNDTMPRDPWGEVRGPLGKFGAHWEVVDIVPLSDTDPESPKYLLRPVNHVTSGPAFLTDDWFDLDQESSDRRTKTLKFNQFDRVRLSDEYKTEFPNLAEREFEVRNTDWVNPENPEKGDHYTLTPQPFIRGDGKPLIVLPIELGNKILQLILEA